MSEERRPVAAGLAGAAGAAVLMLIMAAVGSAFGRAAQPPWLCDDTRYVATVPLGRAVVGPSVAAPPGCGR